MGKNVTGTATTSDKYIHTNGEAVSEKNSIEESRSIIVERTIKVAAEVVRSISLSVRKRPIASVGMAASLGFFLGTIVAGSSKVRRGG
jgi:ElaB/YqjD/DUF883 family membrane-anchored ribosome-binding protein